jgi:hypothetical protein
MACIHHAARQLGGKNGGEKMGSDTKKLSQDETNPR